MPRLNWTVAFRIALGVFFVVSAVWPMPEKRYPSLFFAFLAFVFAVRAAYGRVRT